MVHAFGGNARYKAKDPKVAHSHPVMMHHFNLEHFDNNTDNVSMLV